MVQFDGSYKLEKNENLEELLAKMDVNKVKRKMALMSKPSVEVKVEGDNWTMVTHSTRRTVTWNFKLGEEKELVAADGSNFKATFTLEEDKLMQYTVEGHDTALEIVRQFTDHGMIQELTHKDSGTKCTRTFKRTA
ncbi:fatty acid-binding protein-like [Panulirus ornatus]|uniref:fatty acid-binding protein-like n=1 Tax=Panulirus ornatus TaxID=150431 RepID=UPI003A8BA0E9